ncbi:hypothetical protein ACB098_01G048000 [Castanea mollissima]
MMGKNGAEMMDPYGCNIKVHCLMCLELKKFVDRISKIFPDIESARPRCTSGIKALCSLYAAMDKAELLIKYCSESSRLYLAFTTDKIILKCEKIQRSLELCLSQIQNMVPTLLAAKISGIVRDLRDAKFPIDSAAEEAGKVVRELLLKEIPTSNCINDLELEPIQLAALRLNITTPSALSKEKMSIQRLLDKVPDHMVQKRNILRYFFHLLKKYREIIGQNLNGSTLLQHDESSYQSIDSGTPEPPEEFKCPISMRLMYEPIIIASGKTFERFWIEKWFNEGNKTCPITHMKLDHLSLTPNIAMKALISKWSSEHGITIPDPSLEPHLDSFESMKSSHSSSIVSIGSSLKDLHLQVSSVSLHSLGSSHGSEIIEEKSDDCFSYRLTQINAEPQRPHQYVDCYGKILDFLSTLAAVSWGSQCRTVENVKNQLQDNNSTYHSTNCNGCIKPLIKFLKDALKYRDIKAQRDSADLLLAILSGNRSKMPPFDEDEIYVLASYLESEITGEALAIIEILSCQSNYQSMMVASGVLPSILKLLDTQYREFHRIVMKILCNLSCNADVGYHIVYLDFIPKLVPFLADHNHARFCIKIIRNLCDIEEVRIALAETSSCISAFAKVLETGTEEEQEHAVYVLLSLCHESVEFCQLVMKENIKRLLFNLSVNKNSRGKGIAIKLLQFLEHIRTDVSECSTSPKAGLGLETSRDYGKHCKEKKLRFRAFRFLGNKTSLYSKASYL